MRGKNLLEDIGNIDDKLVEEANKPCDMSDAFKEKKKKNKLKYIVPVVSAAALFVLCFGVYQYAERQKVYEESCEADPVFTLKESLKVENNDTSSQMIVAEENNQKDDAEITQNEAQDSATSKNETEKTAIQMTPVENFQLSVGADVAKVEEVVDELPRLIRIKDVVYYDSGKISTEGRCGLMDGYIDSICDGVPQEEGQSNFGVGYGYQFGVASIEVLIDDEWHIFYPYEAEKVYEIQNDGEKNTSKTE